MDLLFIYTTLLRDFLHAVLDFYDVHSQVVRIRKSSVGDRVSLFRVADEGVFQVEHLDAPWLLSKDKTRLHIKSKFCQWGCLIGVKVV